MSKLSVFFAAALLLSCQLPSLSKAQARFLQPKVNKAIPLKAKKLATRVEDKAEHKPEKIGKIETTVIEQPAVLVPDSSDDFHAPAGALYTDSDDVG